MDFEDIQARYVAELRAALPMLRAWWDGLVVRHGEAGAFERWPTAAAGHPVVLEIFRQAAFAIEERNDEIRDGFEAPPDPHPEALWGLDDPGAAAQEARVVDWLIRDIAEAAPDLYGLAAGLVFVPIGTDQDGESV